VAAGRSGGRHALERGGAREEGDLSDELAGREDAAGPAGGRAVGDAAVGGRERGGGGGVARGAARLADATAAGPVGAAAAAVELPQLLKVDRRLSPGGARCGERIGRREERFVFSRLFVKKCGWIRPYSVSLALGYELAGSAAAAAAACC